MLHRLACLAVISPCALSACSSSGQTGRVSGRTVSGTSAGAPLAAVGTSPIAQTTATTLGADRLLPALTALHRYAATSEELEVVVENQSSSTLPSFLQGSSTFFVGDGSVGASVDFSALTAADVQISPDGHAVTVKLPHAQLSPAAVDPRKSYVVGDQQGAFDRLFSTSPNEAQPLLVEAAKQIDAQAAKGGLIAAAEADTTAMLNAALHTAGFTTVTVGYGA